MRVHAGLFLAYGFALAAPSIVAAAVAQGFPRWLSLVVAFLVVLAAAVCEAFVSLSTW